MAGPLVVAFDGSLHSGDAIQRAAYRFIDRCSTEVTRDEAGNFLCTLTPFDPSGLSLSALESAFRNEVLDQVLRERIREETAGVRNLIWSLAFSETGLADDD